MSSHPNTAEVVTVTRSQPSLAGSSALFGTTISKRVPLKSDARFIQFRTELFNAWNHTQFSGLDSGFRFNLQGVSQNPNIGAYTSARDPRIIQFSLKVFF